MLAFRCALMLLTGLIGGAVTATAAAAQIYVMESTVAAIRVGSALDLSAAISIPAGSHIRAVLPSGKTQTIKGPYEGTVADLAKGRLRYSNAGHPHPLRLARAANSSASITSPRIIPPAAARLRCCAMSAWNSSAVPPWPLWGRRAQARAPSHMR